MTEIVVEVGLRGVVRHNLAVRVDKHRAETLVEAVAVDDGTSGIAVEVVLGAANQTVARHVFAARVVSGARAPCDGSHSAGACRPIEVRYCESAYPTAHNSTPIKIAVIINVFFIV